MEKIEKQLISLQQQLALLTQHVTTLLESDATPDLLLNQSVKQSIIPEREQKRASQIGINRHRALFGQTGK